jgi:hypothetical protein
LKDLLGLSPDIKLQYHNKKRSVVKMYVVYQKCLITPIIPLLVHGLLLKLKASEGTGVRWAPSFLEGINNKIKRAITKFLFQLSP